MDFEEYVIANYKRLEGQTREFVEDAFNAGQQSKQEEVNKLQEEIDVLKAKVNDALEAFNDGSFNYCQKQLEELLK